VTGRALRRPQNRIAVADTDTGTELRSAPTVGSVLLERADRSLCEVREDGWPDDYGDSDMADAINFEPTDRTN